MFSVEQQFADKHIFITGTSGFLGKVVLQRIIEEIPSVAKISILMRGNKHYPDPVKRADAEIFASKMFHHMNRDFLDKFIKEKVVVVEGELTKSRYGLSEYEFGKFSKSVDIVINSAASVDFRERLDRAIKTNINSVGNVVLMSRINKNLAVTHVSTCYTNGYQTGDIYEKMHLPIYKNAPLNSKGVVDVEKMISSMKKEMHLITQHAGSEKAISHILTQYGLTTANKYGFTDTYTFTKWLAEHKLYTEMSDRKVSIVRPAIIEAAVKSPVPGWLEGIKVSDAVIFAFARGKMRTFPARKDTVLDLIPVDHVTNAIILAAAKTMAVKQFDIYQVGSSKENPLNIDNFGGYFSEALMDTTMLPKLTKGRAPKKRMIIENPNVFFAKLKLAELAGSVAKNTRFEKKLNLDPSVIKSASAVAEAFTFYASSGGNDAYFFRIDNTKNLTNEFRPEDQQKFSIDISSINWEDYVKNLQVPGIEKYAIKDKKIK